MLDVKQFRKEVVSVALKSIDLWSKEAEDLVMGTALQESHLTYLVQLGNGPAKGLFQMEPATHDDIWQNYLVYNVDLAVKVKRLALSGQPYSGYAHPDASELVWNMLYACAMCRVHYRRKKQALPTDLAGQAAYWNQHYNCNPNAGTDAEYIAIWHKAYGTTTP